MIFKKKKVDPWGTRFIIADDQGQSADGIVYNGPIVQSVKNNGDRTIVHHVQNVDITKRKCEEIRKETDRGFTPGRTMQMKARIPILIWLKHPEFASDDKAIERWLNSEEGEPYRISKGLGGVHGR